MPGKTVYLEAPDLTQDLLNIKWALRSSGYAIGSTWHEDKSATSSSTYTHHWNAVGIEQLQFCDSLVVVSGKNQGFVPELAMMAGFALARGLRVIWIGAPVCGLSDFRAVQQFTTPEAFRQEIQRLPSQAFPTVRPLAA